MKTYEMVALDEKDDCTYINKNAIYSSKDGFYFSDGERWSSEYLSCYDGTEKFLLNDGWVKDGVAKLTMEQLKSIVGFDFEIVE